MIRFLSSSWKSEESSLQAWHRKVKNRPLADHGKVENRPFNLVIEKWRSVTVQAVHGKMKNGPFKLSTGTWRRIFKLKVWVHQRLIYLRMPEFRVNRFFSLFSQLYIICEIRYINLNSDGVCFTLISDLKGGGVQFAQPIFFVKTI